MPKGTQVAVAELDLPAGLSLEACWPRGELLMPLSALPTLFSALSWSGWLSVTHKRVTDTRPQGICYSAAGPRRGTLLCDASNSRRPNLLSTNSIARMRPGASN